MKRVRQTLLVLAALVISGQTLTAMPLQRTRTGTGDTVRTGPQTRPVVPNRPPARPPIADALEGIFANGLQRRLNLDDRQLGRIRPMLRESLQRRNRLAQESIRRRNELNRALEEDRPEREIQDLVDELDRTDRELRAARDEFFSSVDPHLSPQQRALLRSELPNLEEQIRSLIDRSRRQPR